MGILVDDGACIDGYYVQLSLRAGSSRRLARKYPSPVHKTRQDSSLTRHLPRSYYTMYTVYLSSSGFSVSLQLLCI